jgi:hypothetical protein
VRLAELAVAADSKSITYYNTLGVARYRLGDFGTAIDALNQSFAAHGSDGHDGFFLAMVHARLGHHAEARDYARKADEWMRANQPNNAELIRFRAEAAAVLDVAGDKTAAHSQVQNIAPTASKNAAPAVKGRTKNR